MKNEKYKIIVPSHITNKLVNTIASTELWDYAAYKKNLLEEKEKILKTWGTQTFQDWLNESKERDGKIYETKQQVKSQLDGLTIEIRFKEKGHNIPHFHAHDKQGKINASFDLNNCNHICGKIDRKLQKKIEYWFFKRKGKEELLNLYAKTNNLIN